MEVQEIKEQLKEIFRTVINNDKWITIHPNGEDAKGRHLLLNDGESPKEAIERTYGKGEKSDTKDGKEETKKEYNKKSQDMQKELDKKYQEMNKKWQNGEVDYSEVKKFNEWYENAKKQIKEQFDKEETEHIADLRKDMSDEEKEFYGNPDTKDKQPDTKEGSKDISKEEYAKIKEQVSKMSDDELVKAHFESQKGYESETPRAGSMTKHEATYGEVAQELKRRTGRGFSAASTESEIKEALSKAKSDTKDGIEELAKYNRENYYGMESDAKKHQAYYEHLYKNESFEDLKDKYDVLMSRAGSWNSREAGEISAISKLLKEKSTKDKQSDSKGDLDIKKTTVKMKSGKTKEIEYVNSVPEGYKKLEGAMTAPLGYTWYHNGKSIIDKERKTILVKDKVNNNKEQDMALIEELKKLITKVENTKGEKDMDEKEKVDNKKVDKRKLIDEVGGILKGKVDDEIIRTIMKKMEEASYNGSEDDKADNEKEEDKKEVKEIKEDVKEDIDNKCKNSKPDTSSFDKINEIYNSIKQVTEESNYVSRQEKLDNAVEYFK